MGVSARHQAVQRAISDLRRGVAVVVRGHNGATLLVRAAEQISAASWNDMGRLTSSAPHLLVSHQRAKAIGLKPKSGVVACSIAITADHEIDDIRRLIGDMPFTLNPADLAILPENKASIAETVLMLMRSARLMPAAVVAHMVGLGGAKLRLWAEEHGFLTVQDRDIRSFEEIAASLLHEAARARLPLADCENSKIVIFRPGDGGTEHFALLIGDPNLKTSPPVRIHSQCITGDILGSLKCDCGDQLRLAIRQMAAGDGGILIYLAQEGRDIGLVNKLKAYALQDIGADTVDANHHLGFETDHRYFMPAAEMLRQLGAKSIRLMTNNPEKISQINDCGITVVERLSLITPVNPHNEGYLKTKAQRTGHRL